MKSIYWKRIALVLTVLAVLLQLLLFTAATPPDRYPVHTTSTYELVNGSLIWPANKTGASNAWSTTFAPSNWVYLVSVGLGGESNRINGLVTGATDLSAYVVAVSNLVYVQTAGQVVLSNGVASLSNSLAPVATTGAYADLTGKPTLGTMASQSTNDFTRGIIASTGLTGTTNANGSVTLTATGGGGGGKLVQAVTTTLVASSTTAATIAYDDTIPQNSEGTELMTRSITPTSTSNKIRVIAHVHLANAGGTQNTIALFRDSGADALDVSSKSISANFIDQIMIIFEETAPSTSAVTYKIRIGSNAGSTITINGSGGARKFGGTMASQLIVEEIAP